jgi:outer membrane usher protein
LSSSLRSASRLRRPWALWAILLALGLALAAPASAQDQQAFLTLYGNTKRVGDVLVLLRGPDVYVKVTDLEGTGLHVPQGERLDLQGDTYVRMASLAPTIETQFDEEQLRVVVTAPPELFSTTVTSMAATKPEGFRIATNPSVFLNYAGESSDLKTPALSLESGGSWGGKYLLYSTASRTDKGYYHRGLTSFQIEDHEQLTRLTLGDGVAITTPVGGGGTFGGITFRRDYQQDPYFIRRPDQVLAAVASTPSTARVYMNGILLREIPVPTGPFELHNLLIPNGIHTMDVIVTDAFGRETRTSTTGYFGSNLLKAGEHDYNYTLGAFRLGDLQTSNDLGHYSTAALLLAHRYGWSDRLTLGGRFEAGLDFVSLGPTFTYVSNWGEWTADLGLSWAGKPGAALAMSYSYSAGRFNTGVTGTLQTNAYATASQSKDLDRTSLAVGPFLSYQLASNWNLGLSAQHNHDRDTGGRNLFNLFSGREFTPSLGAFILGNYTLEQGKAASWGISLNFYWLFTRGYSANSTLRAGSGGESASVGAAKSLPIGEGYGWRVNGNGTLPAASPGACASATLQVTGMSDGEFQYHGRFGFLDVSARGGNTIDPSYNLSYAGGLAVVNGHVYYGRPLADGFGAIWVPELPNVHVMVNNQPMGTTDASGHLMVPQLHPYYGNQVKVVTEDIPVDRALDTPLKLAVPALHAGALVEFRTEKIFAINGWLKPQIPDVPEYFGPGVLTLTVNGQPVEGVAGRNGQFYLENLPPGTYEGHLETEHLRCKATITVPETTESFVTLGDVPCVPE